MDYSHKAQEKGMIGLCKYSNQCLFFCQYKIKCYKRIRVFLMSSLFSKDRICNVIERISIVLAAAAAYNREN
jgi:hypothetical protein